MLLNNHGMHGRHGRSCRNSQVFFQQRMAGVGQVEGVVVGDLGDDRPEFAGKFDLCLDEIELRDGRDRDLDGRKLGTKFLGHFEQDAGDLAFLFAFQVLEFVICLDRVERLDKNGRAATTKSRERRRRSCP